MSDRRPAQPAPIRVGLVGYGLAGSTFHAPLIQATEGLELTSVVTADPGRQERARRELPGALVLDRPEALWEMARLHDLVVVATPTRTHLELGLAAIGAGLDVVVDKPLASTAADGRRLADAARAAGRVLSVFHNRRWDGDFLTVEQLIAAGPLGTVTRFESRFERWRPEASGTAWRDQLAPGEGGGILLDLGSHLVDQALRLFGPPVRVYAEVDHRRGTVADDDAFVAIEHENGVHSHLWMSAVAAHQGPRFRVLGTAGAYTKDGLDPQEDQLRGGQRPGDAGFGEDPPERWGRLVTAAGETRPRTAAGEWTAYYAGMVESLRAGNPPPVRVEEAIEVLRVLDMAREMSRRDA